MLVFINIDSMLETILKCFNEKKENYLGKHDVYHKFHFDCSYISQGKTDQTSHMNKNVRILFQKPPSSNLRDQNCSIKSDGNNSSFYLKKKVKSKIEIPFLLFSCPPFVHTALFIQSISIRI